MMQRSNTPAEAKRALFHLSPEVTRDQRLKILMAYKAAGGDSETAETWSRQDSRPAPHGFSPRSFRSAWDSIRLNGRITAGTLFYLAKQRGWNPSR